MHHKLSISSVNLRPRAFYSHSFASSADRLQNERDWKARPLPEAGHRLTGAQLRRNEGAGLRLCADRRRGFGAWGALEKSCDFKS